MATFLRVLIFAAIGWMALLILIFGSRIQANALGHPPIAKPALLLAKLGFTLSICLLVFEAVSGPPPLSATSSILCIGLIGAGILIFSLGLFTLGKNLRVGLPEDKTSLVTSGVYSYSRNPIYVGLYLILGASLLYAFSWVNLVALGIAVVLHHRIILAEEKFLSAEFREYDPYRSKVRRYI